MFVRDPDYHFTWQGWTLIIPAVSVGNVGQLACDLLIHTLSLTKAGCLNHPALQPLCGNDAFVSSGVASGKLVTCCEVYASCEKKIVVVQQRAGLVKGRGSEFRKALLDWYRQELFGQMIILTSCFAYEKTDAHIQRGSFRYLITPKLEESVKDKQAPEITTEMVSQISKMTRLEKKPFQEGLEPLRQEDIPEAAKDIQLSGGGIARRLFVDGCKEDIPMAVLLLFCSEGDNTPDALTMVSHLNSLLHLLPESAKWRAPASWTLLFGRPANPSIY